MSLSLFITSMFFYVNTPVIDMREQPRDNAEIISQAYYTELVNILKKLLNGLKLKHSRHLK